MNKVPSVPELQFDEVRHFYSLNGIKIPSVTEIMRPLTKSHYGEINLDILNAAAKRGKEVHQAIENFFAFGIDDVPPEHEGYYLAFKDWLNKSNPEIIAAESRISHKTLRYAGTSDLACIMHDKMVCVDFKTSTQIVDMLTRVQLEAYSRAFESHGFKFDEKAIVLLHKNGKWSTKTYASSDSEAWEVFGSLLLIHNYLAKNGGK